MNKSLKNTVLILLVLLPLSFLLCSLVFHSEKPATSWNDYSVVYVEKTCPVAYVLDTFSLYGVEGVLSGEHTLFPSVSPWVPLLLPVLFNGFSFSDLQTSYFSDRDDKYNLFYVPSQYRKKIDKVLASLSYKSGVDTEKNSTLILQFILFGVFIVLVFLSKKRLFYTIVALPWCLFSLSAMKIQITACVVIFLYALFSVQQIWLRENAKKMILKNKFFLLVLGFLFIVSVFSSLRSCILFFLTVVLSCSSLLLLAQIQGRSNEMCFFKPVLIRQARKDSWLDFISVKCSVFICSTVFIIVCVSFFIIFCSTNTASEQLYIPSPSGYTSSALSLEEAYTALATKKTNKKDKQLPSMLEYMCASWYFDTLPYRRLIDGTPSEEYPLPYLGQTVSFDDFVVKGHVSKPLKRKIYRFDEDYMASFLEDVKMMQKNNGGAEVLLFSEGSFVKTKWMQAGRARLDIKSIVFICFCFCFSLFIVFGTIRIKRKG